MVRYIHDSHFVNRGLIFLFTIVIIDSLLKCCVCECMCKFTSVRDVITNFLKPSALIDDHLFLIIPEAERLRSVR